MSIDDIAGIMEKSAGTIKTLLHRAPRTPPFSPEKPGVTLTNSSENFPNDSLDAKFRAALRARPIPSAPTNLPSVAILRAQAAQRTHHLRRISFWTRLSTLAAALLIALTLAFAYSKVSTLPSTGSIDTVTQVTENTTESNGSPALIILTLTAIGLSLKLVLNPGPPSLRPSL